MPHKTLQCCWQFISTCQPLANKIKKEVYIFNHSVVPKLKNPSSLHHNIRQYDKWTWVWRGKERRAFSVTLVFEVKILWTGPENIFPRSQLKVHTLPSQKWSFDQKKRLSLSLSLYRVWCWNLYSPPDGIASKHPWAGQPHTHQISNQIQIHEVSLVVCERVNGSIHRTSSRQWRRVFQEL